MTPTTTIDKPTFTESQRRDAAEHAQRLMTDGASQNAAAIAAGRAVGVDGSTVRRWAIALGVPLQRGDAPDRTPHTRAAVVANRNAARTQLAVTLTKQRGAVQDLLRVGLVGTAEVTKQAKKGAQHVDWPLYQRLTRTLTDLHALDGALFLQIGRYDATLTVEENARAARERIDADLDELSADFTRDLATFTAHAGDGAPTAPANGSGSGSDPDQTRARVQNITPLLQDPPSQ